MTPTVRTFRGPDPTAALAAVKAALGAEAVILSTRSVDGGLFRKPEVEITAAIEHPASPPPPRKRPVRPPPPAPPKPELNAPFARSGAGAGRVGSSPARGDASTRSGEPRTPVRPQDDELQDEIRYLRKSVEEARRALTAVTQEAKAGRDMQLPPAGAEVYARLACRGVEPSLAESLVRSALSSVPPETTRVLAAVKDLLGERLVPCRAPWLLDGRHVIAMVGPTGVGKTTTLAKMAARALLETRKRVAFVTVDTYRIGAAEQLARYAEIMGVPVLVARDRSELLRAMERVADADLVLIDTAGRSSPEDVARQAGLVRSVPRVQLQLCVSASTGAMELAAVAERYRTLAPDRLALTKVDEAAGPGSVLSASVRICRPISCVADGQRVPEDIHAFTGPELVDLVVGREP